MCPEAGPALPPAGAGHSGGVPGFEQAGHFAGAMDLVLDRCRRELAAMRPARVRRWAKANVFGGTEMVTAADVAVQRALVRACGRVLPGVPVVAEEGRRHLGAVPPTCVLIDPIDGTGPFLSGSPLYTMSVGLVVDERPSVAVVDFPAYELRVWARATRGIEVRGDAGRLPAYGPSSLLTGPAQAAQVREVAARATGLSVEPVPTTSAKMVLVALSRAGAALRVRGAAAGVAPWDYAAAALIVREAGGVVRDDGGRDLARGVVSPVNGWLACRGPELAAVLHKIVTGDLHGAL